MKNCSETSTSSSALSMRINAYLGFALLCFVLIVWRLGAVPLIGLDESLYSECAREMLTSGDWIVPKVNGQPFFDKPPLCYWLMAKSIRVFGTNSFAVRLPASLSGVALVFFTCWLGTRLSGWKTGLISGVVLMTSVMTVGLARLAVLDMTFALSITLALGIFITARLGLISQWAYILTWLGAGVSLLVKGPAGLVLISTTVIVYVLLTKHRQVSAQTNGTNLRPHLVGIISMGIINLPWYVMVQIKTHGVFLREFLVHQNIQRALGQDFHHNMPFFFYVPIYVIGLFPWSILMPLAWTRFVKRKPKDVESEASLFVGIWTLVIVGIYSLLRSKLPAYIYPSFPASALLIGRLLAESLEPSSQSDSLLPLQRYALASLVLACLVGGCLLMGLKLLPEPIPRLEMAITPMAISMVAGTGACYIALRKLQVRQAVGALLLGVVGFDLAAIIFGLPITATSLGEPAVQVARLIRNTASAEEPVFGYMLPSSFSSVSFYAQRPVPNLKVADGPELRLRRTGSVVIVTEAQRLKELPAGGKLVARWGRYILYRL
ncbi:MAG: ArnT family glycosyltransferase [Armatimonadota bacterium]